MQLKPKLTRDVELLAALALAFLYVAITNGHLHSIDGLVVYRQAWSIAYNHSLRFDPPIWWTILWTTSRYGIGLSLLDVPGLLLWSGLAPLAPVVSQQPGVYDFRELYADPLYVLAAAPVNVVVTAVTAFLVARFIRALGYATSTSLWGLTFFGIASPAIVYSREDFTQPLEGLCWVAALYAAQQYRLYRKRSSVWISGAAVCYAILTRPVEGSLVACAVLLLIIPSFTPWRWRRSAWMELGILGIAYGTALVVTLAVNWGRSGSPFITGYEGFSWTNPLIPGLAGSLLSPGRGIVWEFPAVLLAPIGVWQLWRLGNQVLGSVLAMLCVLQLVNVAAWVIWWGGSDWGLRLFVPALPVLAILAAVGIAALPSHVRRWLPTLLLVGGIVWVIPCIVTDYSGGYAGVYGDPASNWQLAAYAPIGAWKFLRHFRASTPLDTTAIDILWIRMARLTENASLIPLILLLSASALLAIRVRNLIKPVDLSTRRPDEASKLSRSAEAC
jgi:hypothetical protein